MVDAQTCMLNAIAEYADGVYIPKNNFMLILWENQMNRYQCHLFDKNNIFFTSFLRETDDPVSVKCNLEDLMKILNVLSGSMVNITAAMMIDTKDGPEKLYSVKHSFCTYLKGRLVPFGARDLFKTFVIESFENIVGSMSLMNSQLL